MRSAARLVVLLALLADVPAHGADHWGFRRVDAPSPPVVRGSSWVRDPIDRFVLAKLEEHGLEPAPPADRATLLRRVTYSLVGLPPTPEALASFLADPRPDAYERRVEELLSSPAFGERWARHWLDVVRYTETAGHVQDRIRPNAWRYRDYVVDAFNDDLPFTRFVEEHVAGDQLEPRRVAGRDVNVAPIATGFLWFHEMHFKPVDPVLQRADQIDAQIDVVGKAFLGLTVSCARCHDHKRDPISQADYYALAGIFHSTKESHARIAPWDLEAVSDDSVRERAAELTREIRRLVERESAAVRRERRAKSSPEDLPFSEISFPPAQQQRLAKLRMELATLAPRSAQWTPAAVDARPTNARLHRGGDVHQLGEEVPRGFLNVLGGRRAPGSSPPRATAAVRSRTASAPVRDDSGRLFLARELSSPSNPLPARVMVNRIWQHHFGRGLVATPNNFGVSGSRPSHPGLLDTLAAELITANGSLKSIHRRIVLSSTFRVSGRESSEARRLDPTNELLHRYAPRRLEAEAIHDSMLAVAGALDRRIGGESIAPFVSPNATANKPIHIPKSGPVDADRRRSIYVRVRRNFVAPFLSVFDYPDQGSSVAVRAATIGPLQALTLLNGPFAHQQAARWGTRTATIRIDDRSRVDSMLVAALGRTGRPEEHSALLDLVRERRDDGAAESTVWTDVAHVLFQHPDFLVIR